LVAVAFNESRTTTQSDNEGEVNMAWKIGETYKTKNGSSRKLVAIAVDGRLVVENPRGRGLTYRNPDGTFGNRLPHERVMDLIDPDAMTSEERELVIKVLRFRYEGGSSTADALERGKLLSSSEHQRLRDALRLVREIRGGR
jgi:hypothetical protein